VDADTRTVSPSATAYAANSAELHRDSGTAGICGSSHAIAYTSATTCAGDIRGFPDRFRSPNPANPSVTITDARRFPMPRHDRPHSQHPCNSKRDH